MATLRFHPDMLALTNGDLEIEIAAGDYRGCLREVCGRYPGLDEDRLSRYMVSIDGALIQSPFLEKLGADSEIIFIKKIVAG